MTDDKFCKIRACLAKLRGQSEAWELTDKLDFRTVWTVAEDLVVAVDDLDPLERCFAPFLRAAGKIVQAHDEASRLHSGFPFVLPIRTFWVAVSEMSEWLERKDAPPPARLKLETLAELVQQGLSELQCRKCLGLTHEQFVRERDVPGSVIGAADSGWSDPRGEPAPIFAREPWPDLSGVSRLAAHIRPVRAEEANAEPARPIARDFALDKAAMEKAKQDRAEQEKYDDRFLRERFIARPVATE